jgi:hypothetical protein
MDVYMSGLTQKYINRRILRVQMSMNIRLFLLLEETVKKYTKDVMIPTYDYSIHIYM